jgi:mRNA-degrading endonuclease RelE of RelBE toxin-antitoxin system
VADTSGKFRAKAYYDKKLNDAERRRFYVLFEQVAEAGTILNKTRYRRESPNLHAFKSGKHRLICFHDGRDVMVVDALKKKSDNDKRLTRALETAERICAEYRDRHPRGK